MRNILLKNKFIFLFPIILFIFFVSPKTAFSVGSSCTGGCGAGLCCSSFLPGTQILNPDGSTTSVENIIAGQELETFDSNNLTKEPNKVLVNKKGEADYYFYIATISRSVQATKNHPFFVGNDFRSWDPNVPIGYKRADELKIGDFVYVNDAKSNTLKREFVLLTIKINKPVNVYTLTVANNENYFANGFAVHNKFCYDCSGGGTGNTGCTSDNGCAKGECCTGGTCYDKQSEQCGGGGTTPTCTTTAPTNIVGYRTTPNSATVTWTAGANGVSQVFRMGANKAEVEAGCPGTASPACVVNVSGLPTSQTSYDTGEILQAGATYYIRIINYQSSACSSTSATGSYLSSCLISPSALTVRVGESVIATSQFTYSTALSYMIFSEKALRDTPRANVLLSPGRIDPLSASTPAQTTVTGDSTGYVNLTASIYNSAATLMCQDTALVTVIPPKSWWQAIDSDVSALGDLITNIPDGEYFNLPGLGGYPGIPGYTGNTDLTTANVSQVGWLAQSQTIGSKIFDYAFFENQVPDSVVFTDIPSSTVDGTFFETGGTLIDGYYWYKYTGGSGIDLTISSAMNLGDRKVVVFVDNSDLSIAGNINLTDGQGFFGVFVNGSISIDPAVTSLEGVYLADGAFLSGTTGLVDSQLSVRGMIGAYGGVALSRDLANLNATTPAEVFEYAPDQMLLFPSKLGYRKINWKEVAP